MKRRQLLLAALLCACSAAVRTSLDELASAGALREITDQGRHRHGAAASAAAAAQAAAALASLSGATDGEDLYVFVEVYAIKTFGSLLSVAESGVGEGLVLGAGGSPALLEAGGNTSLDAIYHSEVTLCGRYKFNAAQQRELDGWASAIKGYWNKYHEIEESWWRGLKEQRPPVECTSVAYGSSGISRKRKGLWQSKAATVNADENRVWKYIYGRSSVTAYQARQKVTEGKCEDYWSDENYNPVTQNCNFFTSTLLKCAFHLPDGLPSLGVSNVRSPMSCTC